MNNEEILQKMKAISEAAGAASKALNEVVTASEKLSEQLSESIRTANLGFSKRGFPNGYVIDPNPEGVDFFTPEEYPTSVNISLFPPPRRVSVGDRLDDGSYAVKEPSSFDELVDIKWPEPSHSDLIIGSRRIPPRITWGRFVEGTFLGAVPEIKPSNTCPAAIPTPEICNGCKLESCVRLEDGENKDEGGFFCKRGNTTPVECSICNDESC